MTYRAWFCGLLCWLLSSSLGWAQMSAEKQLQTLQAPAGFEVQLFASEPMITNPAAIDIDTHGRVWVAEIQWYRRAAKNPPADAIKVLEDTNGDGKADKVTTFAEGLFAPMSVCVAGDKVYVATSPDLWVYEDKDGDLKADGPPKKLLTGFGGYNHDHGAHSLVLGPDHKWWMAHGDRGFDVKGTDDSHIKYRWGAMLRGELDGSQLEVIAENFRNPYEIAVSSFGEAFCSDNDNDGNRSVRICWILEGGDYGWFGRPPFRLQELNDRIPAGTPFREAWHFRGHVPGYVPSTLVTGFGSPCGMCFYEGDAFGPGYKNAPYHADAGPREVRIYRHTNEGFGMTATSENILTTNGDNYYRPDDVCTAPDGTLYVSDWYDGGVGGHAYNDPNRGRIFRLVPKGDAPQRSGVPGPYENVDDAIGGLKNPNLATQFLAREFLLAQGEQVIPNLERLLKADDANHQARALWVLDRIGGKARELVVEKLGCVDPKMRALAVRILRRHEAQYKNQILPMIEDESAEVQREVLLLAADLEGPEALKTIVESALDYQGEDRYHLETLNVAAKGRTEEVYAAITERDAWNGNNLPLLQLLKPEAAAEMVFKSLTKPNLSVQEGQNLIATASIMEDLKAAQGLLALATSPDAEEALRREAMGKVAGNLAGNWSKLRGDKSLEQAFEQLLREESLQDDALRIIHEQGLKSLTDEVRNLAKDGEQAVPVRQQAIQVLASLDPNASSEVLRELLNDSKEPIQKTALQALITVQDLKTLRSVLTNAQYAQAVRQNVMQQLMGSSGGALVLLRMIDEGTVSESLKDKAIQLAMAHPDSNVRLLFEKFIPEDQRPKRLGAAVKPEAILALDGDRNRGEQIFFQSTAAQCKNCHAVQGKGGDLGPDLSQIGKKYGPAAMLETILDPSKAISHEYVPYVLETESGKVFAGFLLEKTDEQVVLKTIKNELVRVPTEEVYDLLPQKKSLMPELILKDVTAQDAADLLAYLTSLKENVKPVTRFRVLGPFNAGLEKAYPPEKKLEQPDLNQEYKGVQNKRLRWEVIPTTNEQGFPAIDTVAYDNTKELRSERVVHYFLVYAESNSAQEAGFLLGSDDGCQVWVNGKQVHQNKVSRAVGYAQDRFRAPLKSGKNPIVIKVENGSGPGGVSLAISTAQPVKLTTD